MIKEIKMPLLKDGMKSGVVCAFLVKKNDTVKKGQPLFEIEADKVTMQVEAEFDCKIIDFMVEEGDEVNVGDTIMTVE